MRNLKKFLALVLAMVMAFSLMLTANAADKNVEWTDADQIDPAFSEAVDVLSGMKIYQGTGAGFNAAGTITRAEVAALLYRLTTGDVNDSRAKLYAGYGNFTDVSYNDWFAGYVGYCANAGYIKGTSATTFSPYNKVTGYEVLAMILRAVGYDQNGEFTGGNWQVNVSARGTELGVLNDVKSTHYADNLYLASRRDVVASILFAAAQIPTVTYTQLGGYSKYDGLLGTDLNPSLGYKYFGLNHTNRIVLGNQATGEKYTQLGAEEDLVYTDAAKSVFPITRYTYPGATVNGKDKDGNAATGRVNGFDLKVDWKSDLGLFGHEVKVWYDARSSSSNSDGAQPTYALYDKVEKTAVVKVDEGSGQALNVADDGDTTTNIAEAIANEGFTKLADNDDVYFSASFSRIGGGDDTTNVIKANATSYDPSTNTSTVFVLISNDSDKKVDVIIPVVMQIGLVNSVNNQINKDKTFSIDSDTLTMAGNPAVKQSDVMNPEQIVLGNTVVVTEVTARTDNPTAAQPKVYWLDTPTKKVTVTVTAYDWNGTSAGTQTITAEDGTEYKRTIVADAKLASGLVNVKNNTGTGDTKSLDHAKYELTLDMQGNWINAKRVYDNNFIYGTYLDYVTSLGTSTFTNRIVGVDLNGDVQTYDITKYNLDGTNTYKLDGTAANNRPAAVGIPYRGSYDSNTTHTLVPRDTTAANKPLYQGFIVNGDIINGYMGELEKVLGMQSFGTDAGNGLLGTDFVANIAAAGDLVINKDTLKLGVAKVKETGSVNLYLTENTKFIVVNKDGYGTDTLDPKVYNGLTEFLGSSNSVEINAAATAATGVTCLNTEILYTSSPYVYANTGATARQVNTIIIPETALTRVGATGLTYFPNTTNVVDAGGTGAQLFTAYQGGEKVSVWVREGTSAGTDDDATEIKKNTLDQTNKMGSFQYLEDTGDKAADGQPIYKILRSTKAPVDGGTLVAGTNEVCWTGTSNAGIKFVGTTNNGLTAIIDTTTVVGTASVKVVNLVDGYTINNIDDLNAVGSLTTAAGGVTTVTIVVEFAEAGSNQVATIYVTKIA